MKLTREAMLGLSWAVAWLALPAGSPRCAEINFDGPVSGYQGEFQLFPKGKQRPKMEEDTAYLRNGDRLSGVVEGISGGFLALRSELLTEALRIPLGNVRRVLLKDKERSAFEGKARAIFARGDRLRINVKGYDGEELLAETAFSEEVRISKEHLSGILFRHEPRVIYKADFEEGGLCGFEAVGGTWHVQNGKLAPTSGDHPSPRRARLKVHQEGHLRYEWEVSAGPGLPIQARFFLFAQGPNPDMPGNAYWVQVSGRALYLYRAIQNNTQHVASVSLSSNKSARRFEVDYDSRSGTIRVSADGEQVIAGLFSSPIPYGEYIIVSAQRTEGFDNVVVRQVADALLPPAGEGGDEEELVCLVNGDRLTGEVILISEGNVRIKTGYASEPLDVSMEELSSLRFGGETKSEDRELATIGFRNGDQLSGEIINLEEGRLRFGSPYLGDTDIDANDVSGVLFPGETELSDVGSAKGGGGDLRQSPPSEVIRSGFGFPVPVFTH